MKAVIVDYGGCNMFSVYHACQKVGMTASITSNAKEIMVADVVILPGVGAFGDAMQELSKRDLIGPLRDIAASDKPFVGICLGMQLLMEESDEFGRHRGLGIIPGHVVNLREHVDKGVKLPHMGWNEINLPKNDGSNTTWEKTPLEQIANGEYFYFVHSFIVKPTRAENVLSETEYGGHRFCSAVSKGNIFAFQFHPERSGKNGLLIYQNIKNATEAQQSQIS